LWLARKRTFFLAKLPQRSTPAINHKTHAARARTFPWLSALLWQLVFPYRSSMSLQHLPAPWSWFKNPAMQIMFSPLCERIQHTCIRMIVLLNSRTIWLDYYIYIVPSQNFWALFYYSLGPQKGCGFANTFLRIFISVYKAWLANCSQHSVDLIWIFSQTGITKAAFRLQLG